MLLGTVIGTVQIRKDEHFFHTIGPGFNMGTPNFVFTELSLSQDEPYSGVPTLEFRTDETYLRN